MARMHYPHSASFSDKKSRPPKGLNSLGRHRVLVGRMPKDEGAEMYIIVRRFLFIFRKAVGSSETLPADAAKSMRFFYEKFGRRMPLELLVDRTFRKKDFHDMRSLPYDMAFAALKLAERDHEQLSSLTVEAEALDEIRAVIGFVLHES